MLTDWPGEGTPVKVLLEPAELARLFAEAKEHVAEIEEPPTMTYGENPEEVFAVRVSAVLHLKRRQLGMT